MTSPTGQMRLSSELSRENSGTSASRHSVPMGQTSPPRTDNVSHSGRHGQRRPPPQSRHPKRRFTYPPVTAGHEHEDINAVSSKPLYSAQYFGEPHGGETENEEKKNVLRIPISGQMGKKETGRLLNFLSQFDTFKATGPRSFDYEEKYDADKPEEANGPNARVCKVYVDEAEKYDEDMIRGFRDTLDGLLVFAALFSAVVTTFVVDTARAFQTDQALVTNYLLSESILLMRANGNATAMANITPSIYGPESTTFKTSDVWINGLFFTSLSLSLATALLSVLVKQWLQAYTAVISGPPRDLTVIRHLRFMGLMKWKVNEIVGSLPLILHASLAVFFIGFIVYIRALYPTLSWIVVAISGLAFFAYITSIVMQAIDIGCPYRIPLLYRPSRFVVEVIRLLYRRLSAGAALLLPTSSSIPQRMAGSLRTVWQWIGDRFLPDGHLQLVYRMNAHIRRLLVRFPAFLWLDTPSSLKETESSIARRQMGPLFYKSISWLHDMSSNSTVHRVISWSLSGEFFSAYYTDGATFIKDNPAVLETLFKTLFDGLDVDEQANPAIHSLAHLRKNKENFSEWGWFFPTEFLVEHLHRAVVQGRPNHVRYLIDEWGVNMNVEPYTNSGTPLHHASLLGNVQIVRLLLNKGADVNFVVEDFGSPLMAASVGGHLEVVDILLSHGAEVNFQGGEYGSALQASCIARHLDIVHSLLEKGADVNLTGGHYGFALQAAASCGVWHESAIQSRNLDEEQPIYLELVKTLLDHGADVNFQGGHYGSALQAALTIGWNLTAELLRSRGATE